MSDNRSMVMLLANTEITAALARELVESHPNDAARVLERLERID